MILVSLIFFSFIQTTIFLNAKLLHILLKLNFDKKGVHQYNVLNDFLNLKKEWRKSC